jgi:hypothetical protein
VVGALDGEMAQHAAIATAKSTGSRVDEINTTTSDRSYERSTTKRRVGCRLAAFITTTYALDCCGPSTLISAR